METLRKPTVYMWPKTSPHNKYSELLTRSIEHSGLRVEHYDRSVVFRPRRGDIVHMHWPSHSYRARLMPLTAAKSLLFALLLLFFRCKGVRLFWTVHNVWPHSGKTRWEYTMRKFILLVCHRAFVLSDTTKREVAATFGVHAGKLVVTLHGHYVDAYPGGGSDIREKFGIPADRFLFLFIGRINAYKGVDRLLRAFRSPGLPSSELLIAGEVDAEYRHTFAQEIDGGKRREGEGEGVTETEKDRERENTVKIYPHFVEDGELADYLRAADVIVLPYRQITTSGSAILALSHKKPVVAPNLGGLGEYVAAGCGVLYDAADPDGLRKALLASMKLDRQEAEKRIAAKLGELDWSRIAGIMIRAYAGMKEAV